ncbi:MAG: hypothetical protein PHP75_04470 [Methylacidiphilaceae bacterium]|nr:hypothetical protein [Candidatus Methylacidiphilaceae bacterium]
MPLCFRGCGEWDSLPSLKEEGCWIFDRHQETVRMFWFAENAEEPVAVRSFDDAMTTPFLPGFVLEMPRIRQALARAAVQRTTAIRNL